ncbi:MAG: twin-arginine translocase subunit TatC [Pirellula sp.]|jgi:sec-independent protein translocase protein TatC|nr:twin-arginine translocase subunit TatC [Pirellula sp.]
MLKSTLGLKKSDDLFEKSSMSFGDHLEELRGALVKASMWLLGGLFVGVPLASSVVDYVQIPLREAIEQYTIERNVVDMEQATGEKVSPELKNWMTANKKSSMIFYVDLSRLRELVAAPKNGSEADAPNLELEALKATENTSKNTMNAKDIANSDAHSLPTPDLLAPIRLFQPIKAQAEAFNIQEPMFIWFKAALMVAFIVASPGIFYHVWGFVAAGLYPHERRYVYFFLPSSIALFLIGALFAFFVVFQLVISFLLNFNSMMGVGTTPRLEYYMSFALLLPLGFGISFQLPLVMLVIERLGIMTVKTYIEQWRIAAFAIAAGSMVLTPGGDWTSMVAMAVPLLFLYFLGILLCKYLPRSQMLDGSASDPR